MEILNDRAKWVTQSRHAAATAGSGDPHRGSKKPLDPAVVNGQIGPILQRNPLHEGRLFWCGQNAVWLHRKEIVFQP